MCEAFDHSVQLPGVMFAERIHYPIVSTRTPVVKLGSAVSLLSGVCARAAANAGYPQAYPLAVAEADPLLREKDSPLALVDRLQR